MMQNEMNLCGGRVVGSMTLPSASPTRKPGDAASDQFPAGLRVLVVDDDPTCLKILERMLQSCQYEVTKSDRAENALNELRRNKNGFDIVISDVHMPDMDGFKLLERVGLEMDLPVIMMSADDSKDVVMKGVVHGACDYLIKPVRMEALKNIWQHVVRKKKNEWKDVEQSGSYDEGDRAQKQDEVEYSSTSMNDGNWKSSKRKIEDEEGEGEDRDDNGSMKKPRVVWSVELHQQFVVAVNQLGIDKAVPKKILELMNVPGLTRENVASHLQKYRLYLRRLSGVSHHQGILSSPFMSPQDPGFGTMSPLDLQTLAVAGQLRGPTLSGYQPGLSRTTMPFVDQRNPFSLETPKLRYPEGQHMQQLNNNNNANKQINLLHGIPTTMGLKQLAGFHHQLPQTTSGQLMNERSLGSQISQIQSCMRQTISSTGVLPRTGIADNSRAMPYCSASQASSTVDFTSKGLIQAELNSNLKGPSGFSPKYDMFNQIPHQKAQDWQSSSLSYGVPQNTFSNTNNIDLTSPIMLNNQGFSAGQKSGLSGNSFVGNTNTVVSTGIEVVLQQGSSSQTVNNNNFSSRVKSEIVQELNSGNNLYPSQFADDDLMSAFLKQQEGIGSVEGEFDFDGYTTLDNIPV